MNTPWDLVVDVRLPPDLADAVTTVADVDGLDVREALVRAAAQYVGARKRSPEFQQKLAARIDRDRRLLDGAETGR